MPEFMDPGLGLRIEGLGLRGLEYQGFQVLGRKMWYSSRLCWRSASKRKFQVTLSQTDMETRIARFLRVVYAGRFSL